MKKAFVMCVVMLTAFAGAWAQRTVTVEKAGSLGAMIPQAERASVTSLKVSGPLNGSDVLILREMGKSKLAELDLTDASIVSGGACYFPVGSDQDAYTQNDRFSTRFFYGCNALRSITIPKTLMSVSNDAFSSCHSLVEIKVPQGLIHLEILGISYEE